MTRRTFIETVTHAVGAAAAVLLPWRAERKVYRDTWRCACGKVRLEGEKQVKCFGSRRDIPCNSELHWMEHCFRAKYQDQRGLVHWDCIGRSDAYWWDFETGKSIEPRP